MTTNATDPKRYEQYLICKERGHNPDPLRGSVQNAVFNALSWYTCVYCGTEFATKTTVEHLERNVPEAPEVINVAD